MVEIIMRRNDYINIVRLYANARQLLENVLPILELRFSFRHPLRETTVNQHMLAVTRLHQIAHNRNLVVRHGPNLHQIQTLHGILDHKLLLGMETSILSYHSCWRSSRPGVSFLLTPSHNSCWPAL